MRSAFGTRLLRYAHSLEHAQRVDGGSLARVSRASSRNQIDRVTVYGVGCHAMMSRTWLCLALLAACASTDGARSKPAQAVQPAGSDHYLHYVAFELPFGDAVLLRWSDRQMPLKIFLPEPPEGLFSAPEVYFDAVRAGVLSWTDVAGPGLPRFEFVEAIGDADIPIQWAREPQGNWYVAYTMMNVVPSQRRFDVAQLLVTARWAGGRIAAPEEVCRVVLHEMGHALGFAGHSPDPGDVMYPSATVTELSERDRATLAALYARPVGARVTGAKGSRYRD
jgi:predicted Zn-dependent protease